MLYRHGSCNFQMGVNPTSCCTGTDHATFRLGWTLPHVVLARIMQLSDWGEPYLWMHEKRTLTTCLHTRTLKHWTLNIKIIVIHIYIYIHSVHPGLTTVSSVWFLLFEIKRVLVYNSTIFYFTDLFILYIFIQNAYADKKV